MQDIDAALAKLQQVNELMAEQVPSQRLRTMGQGMTLGHSDEIEAFIRSGFSDRKYDDIRDEIRGKLSLYKQQNPNEALSYELVGALVPTAAMIMTGVGAPSAGAGLLRAAGVGALEGGAAGLGYSDDPTKVGMAVDTTLGAGIGAIINPTAQAVFGGSGVLIERIKNFAQDKFGKRASTAAMQELNAIIERTGKSIEEILADVEQGIPISDNKTLDIVLKSMVNQGGEAGQQVLQRTQARALETRREAQSGLQQTLAPDMDANVIRGFKQAEDEVKALESEAYDKVFDLYPEVDGNVTSSLLDVVQRSPQLVGYLNDLYAANRLVPLFKIGDNGAIEFARMPSLKDAEIARRGIDNSVDKMFKAGDNEMATTMKPFAQGLRNALDEFSPELQTTRFQSAQRFDTRRAFDLGRKALSTNVDELEMLVEKLANKPEQFQALKAGLMDAIRVKMRGSQKAGVFRRLADEDQQFGAVLRTVLDPQEMASLERSLTRAADTQEIASFMPTRAGSPTQALQQEAARREGRGPSVVEATTAMTGDPAAILNVLSRIVKSKAPSLTEAERSQVVEVIFSRDPDLVRQALVDETALTRLIKQTQIALDALAGYTGMAGTQQTTQAAQDLTGNR